ncbi:MAG: hypothetical protein DRQ48_00025 [Gammaproteobacteria bacterium]|nr:MAG: hypothetical protein DRQ48_00025 [Gammaproteobacteria bacterium]
MDGIATAAVTLQHDLLVAAGVDGVAVCCPTVAAGEGQRDGGPAAGAAGGAVGGGGGGGVGPGVVDSHAVNHAARLTGDLNLGRDRVGAARNKEDVAFGVSGAAAADRDRGHAIARGGGDQFV